MEIKREYLIGTNFGGTWPVTFLYLSLHCGHDYLAYFLLIFKMQFHFILAFVEIIKQKTVTIKLHLR